MCGIFGYTGEEQAVSILLRGLARLEYRGYDSAGVALCHDGQINVQKAKGRLAILEERLKTQPIFGTNGIGHTRWATHGEPSDINSHPHTDVKGNIAVVHNGIIENYLTLKNWLINQGCVFVSGTDTEVVAHMLDYFYKGNMLAAISEVTSHLQGSFALGIICRDNPDTIYCTRNDSPLVIGRSKDGSLIASDIPAILEHTRDIYLLENMEIAVLTKDEIKIYDEFGQPIEKEVLHINWDIAAAEKGGFEHFMLKEIYEQPTALKATLDPLVDVKNLKIKENMMPITSEVAQKISNLTIVGCGTAYHAGIVGKSIISQLAKMHITVDIASEYRYSNPILGPNDMLIVVSQSGETADTVAAMREAKKQKAKVLAITNVVGSTIDREADYVIRTGAGPEIAVASTKAFSSQIMVFYILALDLAKKRGTITDDYYKECLSELINIPNKVKETLKMKELVQRFAYQHFDHKHILFIGRGLDYALAMESSLKLKEVSYIYSEAYAAGELKHGTIALVEPGVLIIALSTQDSLLPKMVSNITEVKVRGAEVLAITNPGCKEMEQVADTVWSIPAAKNLFASLLAIIPMQFLAYYTALEKGCDIDKPRNLAKSVTVE